MGNGESPQKALINVSEPVANFIRPVYTNEAYYIIPLRWYTFLLEYVLWQIVYVGWDRF